MAFRPDPKDGKRIVDPKIFTVLHARWTSCPLCAFLTVPDAMGGLSLHHILPKGSPYFGDDLEENLVMLCGSGTTGHHGLVEHGDDLTLTYLGRHLRRHRPDVLGYVRTKLGYMAGTDWLERHLRITGL